MQQPVRSVDYYAHLQFVGYLLVVTTHVLRTSSDCLSSLIFVTVPSSRCLFLAVPFRLHSFLLCLSYFFVTYFLLCIVLFSSPFFLVLFQLISFASSVYSIRSVNKAVHFPSSSCDVRNMWSCSFAPTCLSYRPKVFKFIGTRSYRLPSRCYQLYALKW